MKLGNYNLLKEVSIKCIMLTVFIIVLLNSSNISAWDSDFVHPMLSEVAVRSFMLSKGHYMEANLGIKNGIEEKVAGKKLYGWVRTGASDEDKALRFLNHFHNPIFSIESWGAAGLDDFWFRGFSSVIWAQANVEQAKFAGGDWSWIKMRRDFWESLWAEDKIEREKLFSKTLLCLGHQIHLIQDMAVPAHVRNDAHPLPYNSGGSPIIEKWAKDNFHKIRDITNTIVESQVHLNQETIFNDMVLSPIARLSDNDKYNVPNPPISPNLGLAEYTNGNFFSDDTIFTENSSPNDPHGFPYPSATGTNLQHYIDKNILPTTIIAKDGVEDLGFWIEKTGDGEKISRLVKPTYFTYELSPEMHPALYHRLFYLDEACHQEYAEKLIPRAVGYSTALIDYFFRGQLSIVATPRFSDNSFIDIKLNVQNTTETQESLSDGHFYLVIQYKKEDTDIFVRADNTPPSGELAYQDSVELKFNFTIAEPISVEEWKDISFTLAFRGTMGNEINATVGKVFKPVLKDLFSENWDNGIDPEKWQNTGDNDDQSTQATIGGYLIMESTQSSNHNGVSRINSLRKNFNTDSNGGILITKSTYFQFDIPTMESFFEDHPEWANHALLLYFSDGTVIEYTGDGCLYNWTSKERLIPHNFEPGERITDNIYERFEIGGHPIPDPLFLESVQFMQLASFDTLNDYYFFMEVDDIRLFDAEWEEQ